MNLNYKIKILLLALPLLSCNDSNFSSQKQPAHAEPPKNDEFNPNPQEETTGNLDPSSPSQNPISPDDQFILSQQCWFAVSGWNHGVAGTIDKKGGQNTFPRTLSGQPIASGQMFDSVGGVFLLAREEPYVNGDSFISLAIKNTFDSIAVPPGMAVELRDGYKNILYQGEGPMLGIENMYASRGPANAQAIMARPDFPQWMRDYITTRGGFQPLPLQKTHWVRVSKIPGSVCDYAF